MPMYAVSTSKFHNDQTFAPTTLNTMVSTSDMTMPDHLYKTSSSAAYPTSKNASDSPSSNGKGIIPHISIELPYL